MTPGTMDDALLFFNSHPAAYPIYQRFAAQVLAEVDGAVQRVQKSQISFYNSHMFACVSFARVRKAAQRPSVYLVVTLGLARRLDPPRVDAATEAYPGRWTHHITLAAPEEVDGELMAWVHEAAAFAVAKR